MSANQNSHVSSERRADDLSHREGFQEPKPPRTPERMGSQPREGSPPSKRKRFTPRMISGPPCEAYKSPLQVPKPGYLGEGQAEARQSQGTERQEGRGPQEGWPAPAMTTLGSHIQNHLIMRNEGISAYESPIVPVKQLPSKAEDLPDQQQYQMIDSHKNLARPEVVKNPEVAREANQTGSLKSAPQKVHANHADNATFTDQGSTTMGATRNNWVHQTPKMAEHPLEEDIDTGMSNQYPGSAAHPAYPPYGPMYYPSGHYCYPGVPAGAPYPTQEYAAVPTQGYPVAMVSPQRGHPSYAARPHPSYYYDNGVTAYPPPPSHYPGYYPGPSGPPPMGAYADYSGYKHPSSVRGTPCRGDPRYSTYWGDEHMPPSFMYPPPMAYAFDGSPGHHMMPPVMRSPHQRHLSVNASSQKKKQLSSEHRRGSAERQNGHAEGMPSSRARDARIHPRHLDFNEPSVEQRQEQERQEINFEDIDATEQQKESSDQEDAVADNDDNQFEGPKIKLNSARKHKKSRFETPQGVTETTKLRTGSSSVQVMVERKLGQRSNSSCNKMNPNEAQQVDYAHENNHLVSIQSQPVTRRNMPLKDDNADFNDHIPNFANQSSEQHSQKVSVTHDGKVILQRKTEFVGSRAKEVQIMQVDADSNCCGSQDDNNAVATQSAVDVKQPTILPVPGRRGYMYNETNGEMIRVIRKRKRKTQFQLEELANAFEENPHWSKETLLQIASATQLTEAQVYKWGWDQKRKKFGVDEAERMRKYENILDQQNALKKQQQAQLQSEKAMVASPQRVRGEAGPSSSDLGQSMAPQGKIQQQLHASAEAAINMNEYKSTTVSSFPDMVMKQHQVTARKPNGGHLQNENLQKSAVTKATTLKASCLSINQTPKDKNVDFLAQSSDVDEMLMGAPASAVSEKFTPQASAQRFKEDTGVDSVSSRRMQKQQSKESYRMNAAKRITAAGSSGTGTVGLDGEEMGRRGSLRQTRKQTTTTSSLREESDQHQQGEGRTRRQRRGQIGRSASGEAH